MNQISQLHFWTRFFPLTKTNIFFQNSAHNAFLKAPLPMQQSRFLHKRFNPQNFETIFLFYLTLVKPRRNLFWIFENLTN